MSLRIQFAPRLGRIVITFVAVLWCSPTIAAEQLSCTRAATPDHSIATVTTQLAGVPAVLRIPEVVSRPPVVLWHGFGPPASERALMDALPLDELPAIKVYLGLPLFGARAPPDFVKELSRRQEEDFASLLFEPSVMGAARELHAVIQSLREHGCMKPDDRIGLFGFSAGGASALNALVNREVPIGVVVTLNASTGLSSSIQALERVTKQPYKWTAHARQLAESSDAVLHAAQIASGKPPPALLIVHGADDKTMAPEIALSLHAALLPHYREAGYEQRLRVVIQPGMPHRWLDAQNTEELRRLIGKWFEQHL
jgi:predicted esterase